MRAHLFGDALRRRIGVDGAFKLPLPEEREYACDDEARAQHRDPAAAQHDLAQGRRELLGLGHGDCHCWYGESTTSTRWNSFRSEYPVVAMDLRSAAMRFAVPSATGAGP